MTMFKPMKGDDADLSRLVFPYLLSPKLDGHRCVVRGGVAYTSAMKPFPNKFIQHVLGRPEHEGLDGELIVGDPTHPDVFRLTSSGVRRASGEPDFAFYVFDDTSSDEKAYLRFARLGARSAHWHERVKTVMCATVENKEAFEYWEEHFVAQGYEGVMLRHPDSPYKHGRSTVKENYLLKVKRFIDNEAEIIGFVEQMHNTNEKTTNELGRSQRSSAKAGKVGKDTLGALKVRAINGLFAGVEFEIGTGFDDALRQKIWNSQHEHHGRVLTFKHQPVGGYDKPRIPVFKGFRDRAEVT